MNIILFGPPGAGKGTQSALLVDKLNMFHISTGDLLRAAIKEQSTLGMEAKAFMDKGELVPDEVVIGLVREKLEGLNGQSFILDGFPRTAAQAESLEQMLQSLDQKIEKALFLEVPRELLMSRLTGRWLCKSCGAVYHMVSHPPKTEGVCDSCGSSELYQRDDDKAEVIGTRLDAYSKSTLPLVDYYKQAGKYVEVNGVGETEEIFESLKSEIH